MNLSRFEIASIKRTAQNVKSLRKKVSKLNEKINALVEERERIKSEIDMWESPIISKYGYSSEQILSGEADKIAMETENMPACDVDEVDDETSTDTSVDNTPFQD